mgnify:CR=1 FL=1
MKIKDLHRKLETVMILYSELELNPETITEAKALQLWTQLKL